MVAAPLRDHEIDKNKKPDLLQNESCGRLDREQAGLCSESPRPPALMKGRAKKKALTARG
jgi:hypothetical protein